VRSSRAWIVYSLARIGVFAAVFAALSIVGLDPIVAALIAAAIGLCVSYIFLRRPRDEVARSVSAWRRGGGRDADADAENELLDAAEGSDASARPVPPAPPADRGTPSDLPSGAGSGSEGERRSEGDAEHQRREAGQA